ncbi:hypothetical protein ABMA32_03550 [Mesorhizobium sp. VNQ89]|uniref:hypothetical protein n=1 Tax=Mesorhizobium quangtriensis TaxID=3157709 RepID=UPI001A3907B5|nr:hypothetical protein [Mesorhizobium sp.]MBL8577694.1 hypothetical protein [Mesorhizobium sp.]
MAQRRNFHDRVLIIDRCPRQVQALLLFLAGQGDLDLYQVEPEWAPVFLSELEAYSAAGSGPDHGA